MKKTALTLALIGLSGLAASTPGMASAFQDRAEVISSTPVYESVNDPRRECWNEPVGYETTRRREYGGAVLGGLVGGLLGSQFGKGSGRLLGTAAGAATGAIVGDNIDNDGHQAVAGAPSAGTAPVVPPLLGGWLAESFGGRGGLPAMMSSICSPSMVSHSSSALAIACILSLLSSISLRAMP